MIESAASKSFANANAGPRGLEVVKIWLLTGLNLVCLDAPLVAVAWEAVFARTLGLTVPRGGTIALFLTAWLIYLADRLGDSLTNGPTAPSSLRQRFCLAHRAGWLVAIAGVALADFWLIVRAVRTPMFGLGLAVGLCALVYLILNQTRPRLWRRLPLKEVSIGVLFAAGTIVPIASGLTSSALPVWGLFASLCSLNCVSIAVWERELDEQQGRISVATEFPQIGRWLLPALLLLASIDLALGIFSPLLRPICLCLALSAGLLAIVHRMRNKIQSDIRTALADLVLLTPLMFLF